MQVVTCEVQPGEMLISESGTMVYMSGNATMNAKARGGLWKGVKRKFAGESFFLVEYQVQGGPGYVAFGGNCPGTIKPMDLRGGKQYITQKDAFLASEATCDFDIAFQKKLGAGLFGGEGFILQRHWGEGTVFLHACGDFVEMTLGQGQVIKVDTGSVVGWEPTVQYAIERAGNVKTMFFGGEGIFVTTLTGPGHVLLQSMNLRNLATALMPYVGGSSGSGAGGLVGGLLGG